MHPENSRRKFLKTTLKGSAIVGISTAGMSEILSSCSGSKKNSAAIILKTGFSQQPLPYSYDALENIIDAKTMEIHYSKHAAAYSKNLIEAALAENVSSNEPLENVLANISKYSAKMRNNGGGHYNHEMFWKCMRPLQTNNIPVGKSAEAINKAFGSFDVFKKEFAMAGTARFGSGWAWLYLDNGLLKIGSTPNQDNPLMNISDIKGFPVLCLDVWEHAYYLKYQNKRADYIQNWWELVNWDYVEQRFKAAA